MKDMQRYIISVMFIGAVSAVVYKGQGEMHYSHKYEYLESGFRMVYRPESYRTYSPVGLAGHCHFKAFGYLSDYYLNANYYTDVIATDPYDWTILDWDNDGKYYYFEDYSLDIKQGYLIAFAMYIYDEDHYLIYNDSYRYYTVPNKIDFCELDHEAGSYDKKCSEIFDGSSYSGKGNSYSGSYGEGSSSTVSAGTIAAAVIVIAIVIAIVVGVVVCIKKGGATALRNKFQRRPNTGGPNNSGHPNTGVQMNQLQQPNAVAPTGQVNAAYNPPSYQPVAQPHVVYQPPPPAVACYPAPLQPPPYQPAVAQPAVIQPTMVQPKFIQQAPVQAQPSAPSAPSLITPHNLKIAAGAVDLVGSALGAFGSHE
ncbi:uncharacterized protein [Watersipora subatra]|uniref:uncharacterized protein n=1 Tax=Watersipora subatra TaxID=2589382 RepID=UPI00355B85E1